MGAPAALSGFELTAVLSVPGSACDGPAKHTKNPVASINAERPLALIVIGNLPICQPPKRNETSRRVRSGAERGNLRASPGESRATIVPRAPPKHLFVREIFSESMRRVPAGSIDVMSPAGAGFAIVIPERGREGPKARWITTS